MNKQMFFESIADTKKFDEEFFKKVYGYSVYDNEFLSKVSTELIRIKRSDAIQSYNNWYKKYTIRDKEAMRKVSRWFLSVCEETYQDKVRKVKKINDQREKYKFTGLPQDW